MMSNPIAPQQSRRDLLVATLVAFVVIAVALVLPPAGRPSVPTWALATHITCALIALPLGAWVLYFSEKGSVPHKQAGKVWVIAMLGAAFSAFFIQSWGRFSPIHIFSVWTPVSLALGIRAARRGEIVAHRGYMKGSYIGLVVAGVLSVALPGRFLWRYFSGLLT